MNNNRIKIVAVGDIFLGESSLKVGRGVTNDIKEKGAKFYTENIKSIIGNHDICFGNLETIMSNVGRNVFDVSSIEMRGKPDNLEILSAAGFNILNIANNHIFQHGLAAYLDTVARLHEQNIKVVGDEYYAPGGVQVFELGNVEVGFVGFSLHYEQYRPNEKIPYALRNNYEDILEEIRTIRDSFEGVLICSLHWGFEFLEMISCEQRKFSHDLVDNGVSVILGHHPHVLQSIERYKDAIIAYSLGNFIFDMDFDFTTKSLALSFTVNRDGVVDWEYIPFEVKKNSYCPCRLLEDAEEQFGEYFSSLNKAFKNEFGRKDTELKKIEKLRYAEVSRQAYIDFFRNFLSGKIYYSLLIITRALLRRVGVIHNP